MPDSHFRPQGKEKEIGRQTISFCVSEAEVVLIPLIRTIVMWSQLNFKKVGKCSLKVDMHVCLIKI